MNILVTGAAGLLGGELCRQLVEGGHHVTAMVHKNPVVRSNDGAEVAVAASISGDITKQEFGWTGTDYETCAHETDIVVHSAATVRFDLQDSDYEAINVGGTARAVAFAKRASCPFVHISTAYVCGLRNGTIAENDPVPQTGFANGYERSKAAAEQLVRASAADYVIARPSIVVGDSRTGAIRNFDSAYALFQLMAKGRLSAMPVRQGSTLDFVPIDHVTNGLRHLVETIDAARGKTVHLTSANPVSIDGFAAAFAKYPQFQRPSFVPEQAFDPEQLPSVQQRIYRRIAAQFASYFTRDHRFDDGVFRALGGQPCPPTGDAFIRQLIDYAIAAEFLPRA